MGYVSIGGICMPPVHLYTTCTSICSPYTICQWSCGSICMPNMSWSLFGGHQYICQTFVSVSTSICLSVHNSHTSHFPSLWVASLLDWMPMDVCYVSCCCSFLVVFIMSQASSTTAMTTTPLVTVVCSGTLCLLSMVTMVPSLIGIPATSGQHDVVLPPLLTSRHSGGFVGLATVPQQQPPSQMPLQAYAMGPPQVCFSFRVEPSTILYFYMFGVCSGVCFLLSGAMVDVIFTCGDSKIKVCTIAALWSLPMAGICATW